jgi:uncharacterized protein YecT (DUF1311 family)
MVCHNRSMKNGPGWLMPLVTLVGTLAVAVIGIPSVGATASTPTTAPVTYNQSCRQSAMTQIAMDECAESELKQVQTQLTTLLHEDSTLFGGKTVNKVQGQWRRFRDSECALEASINKGGTIAPFDIGECEIQMTVQRIQALSTFLQSRPH